MSKIDPKKYQKILSGLDLKNIRLKKIDAELKGNINKQNMLVDIDDNAIFDCKENIVKISNEYIVAIKTDECEQDILTIKVSYELTFTSTEEFTNDFFDIYKEISLPLNVWPFIRECVNSLSARMNIPPLTLPLLKRIKKVDSNKKSNR